MNAPDPSTVAARLLELLARPDRPAALLELWRFLYVEAAPAMGVPELVDLADTLGAVVAPDDTRVGIVAAITVELIDLAGGAS